MLLQEWRKNKGFTQLTLALRLGVSKMTVASWEQGLKVPRRKHIEKLVELTEGDVTANDFHAPTAPEQERAA